MMNMPLVGQQTQLPPTSSHDGEKDQDPTTVPYALPLAGGQEPQPAQPQQPQPQQQSGGGGVGALNNANINNHKVEGADSGTLKRELPDAMAASNIQKQNHDGSTATESAKDPAQKKQRVDNGKNNEQSQTTQKKPSLPGFDLDLEAPKEIIPPSKVGTSEFNEADVLSGRGGGTNVHPGNRDFRDLINKYRTIYLKAKKNDKPAISRAIVKEVRSRGGRFLKKNERDNLYYEIGDAQAREKTSQALRQRAPEMRKLMFEQQTGHLGAGGAVAPGISGGGVPGAALGHHGMGPPGTGGTGLSEEQLRMAMPLLAMNGMNPEFAAGLQAGMGATFHPNQMMAAAAGNAGHLMGASTYNPALFQAMMSMGGGAMPPGAGMGFEATAGAPVVAGGGGAHSGMPGPAPTDPQLHGGGGPPGQQQATEEI